MITESVPWSLSPAVLRAAPAPPRLVLPSPNGSAIAKSAAGGTVVAGCLRNAAAVGAWLSRQGFGTTDRPVTVIAAGEKWPDGGLRPSLEDQIGAGAVLAALGAKPDQLSSEAALALNGYTATGDVAAAVRDCGSGIELRQRGFGADVDVAVELDSSQVVPVLHDDAFTPHQAE